MNYAAPNLPPLYAKWMDALLGAPIPPEKRATCEKCAMCRPDEPTVLGIEKYYSPVTKCCTYQPELANYLVGRILADDVPDAAEGRRSVEQRIERRADVTPLGLGRSRVFVLLYTNGTEAFGRATSMECPHHLPDGRCGVWRHRESTCATWFCKHERGQLGKHFWRRIQTLLKAAEGVLSRHCVERIGLPPAALERLFPAVQPDARAELTPEQVDGVENAEQYAAIWGDFVGREHEFYRRSAEIVDTLDFDEVLRLGGSDLKLQARLTEKAFQALVSDRVPERPRQRSLQVLNVAPQSVCVATYSDLDPMVMPEQLFRQLHYFDGRPTADAIAALEAEQQLKITPGVVRKLVDFGVLEES